MISNFGGEFRGIAIDGEYKRLNETVFVKNDGNIESKKLMLIYKLKGNGWSGCSGFVNAFEPNQCKSGGRWAFIPDLALPRKGNVNIWSKKGDSSGIVECGKHGRLLCTIFVQRISIEIINL